MRNIQEKYPFHLLQLEIVLTDLYENYYIRLDEKNIYIKYLPWNKEFVVKNEKLLLINSVNRDIINFKEKTITPIQDEIVDLEYNGCFDSAILTKNDVNFYNLTADVNVLSNEMVKITNTYLNGTVCYELNTKHRGIFYTKYKIKIKTDEGVVYSNDLGEIYFRTKNLPRDPYLMQQKYLFDLNVIPAWKYYSGKEVKVAFLDTDLYWHHDLNVSYVENINCEFGNMHALAVAGVVAAQNNNESLVGIAFNSKINFHPILCENGYILTSNLTAQIFAEYDIINNSWVKSLAIFDDMKLKDDNLNYLYAVINGRNKLGTIVIFAAGNDRKEMDANFANTGILSYYAIVVGAIINKDAKIKKYQEGFSCIGANILISAPGHDIYVLGSKNCKFGECKESISIQSGTSFSTSMVTGAVALMLEANPNLGWRDVQEILAITANFVYESNNAKNGATNLNSKKYGMHYDNEFGYGRVDVDAATRLAESWRFQQTSENLAIVRSDFMSTKESPCNKKEKCNFDIKLENNVRVETVVLKMNYVNIFDPGLMIRLISPSNNSNVLFAGRECKELDIKYEIVIIKEIESKAFYGEDALGTWRVEIEKHENCQNKIISENIDYFSLSLLVYGKDENFPVVHYFTDELDLINDAELLISEKVTEINSAASLLDLYLNITENGKSRIGEKSIIFEQSYPVLLTNIICGDGNDVIAIEHNHTTIVPGRGQNEIYLYNNSKAKIYIPNADVHAGSTIIHTSDFQFVEIAFAGNKSCINNIVNSTDCDGKLISNMVDCSGRFEFQIVSDL